MLRNMIDQVFRRNKPSSQTPETTKTSLPTSANKTAHSLMQTFGAETERLRILDVCQTMYKADPRIKKMHRQLGRDVVKGGYIIRSADKRAMEIARALQERLKLNHRLDDYVRLAARDGDLFLQTEISAALEIVGVTRKPVKQMRRNSNTEDLFDDPARAFWMHANASLYPQPPKDATWFADWEIIHARWEHDEGERYGSPMMSSGTGPYKKVTEGEVDVAVRRKTRSGMRYIHALEGATPAELEKYKEDNALALQNPFSAIADFFTNRKGSIASVQGDGDLEKIGDIKHHIATMFASGEVPMELVAYGEGLNRDTLGMKKEEYDETLDVLRTWVSSQVIVPLLELEWLLHGIYPPSVKYTIEWRAKSIVKAADIRDITDAAMRLRILGYSEEVVRAVVSLFLPNIDPDMLDAGADDQDAAQRMADIMQQMRGGLA
ncbi:MAG TPA: hypothetical protein DCG54_07610 [Anaerolineae bacterium]|jgi:hypothetical protein|nr:hypothetical protein [Anaerolineae bacterium]